MRATGLVALVFKAYLVYVYYICKDSPLIDQI